MFATTITLKGGSPVASSSLHTTQAPRLFTPPHRRVGGLANPAYDRRLVRARLGRGPRAPRAPPAEHLPSAPSTRDLLLLASRECSAVLWDHGRWRTRGRRRLCGRRRAADGRARVPRERAARIGGSPLAAMSRSWPSGRRSSSPTMTSPAAASQSEGCAEEAAGDAAAALIATCSRPTRRQPSAARVHGRRARARVRRDRRLPAAAAGGARGVAAQARRRGAVDPLAAPPGGLLVAIHGWLLEYPVVYCLGLERAAAAAAAANCLGGQPLALLRLTARHPPEPEPQLVCAFSLPVCVVDAPPLERPSVDRWWRALQARLRRASWRGRRRRRGGGAAGGGAVEFTEVVKGDSRLVETAQQQGPTRRTARPAQSGQSTAWAR